MNYNGSNGKEIKELILDSSRKKHSRLPRFEHTGQQELPIQQDGATPCKKRKFDDSIKWVQSSNLLTKDLKFDGSGSGIRSTLLNENSTELEIFEQLFTEESVNLIVQDANRHHQYLKKTHEVSERMFKCEDTNRNEIMLFLALYIRIRQGKFSSNCKYLSVDWSWCESFFYDTMEKNRFFMLMEMLQFADSPNHQISDRLHKLCRLMNSMRNSFTNAFYPFENLCIDEIRLSWNDRPFRNCDSLHRSQFYADLVTLSDCKTGYIVDFITYTGEDTAVSPSFPQHHDLVVLTLLQPYLGKGHKLHLNNLSTSTLLFERLYKYGVEACGFVKLSRDHFFFDNNHLKTKVIKEFDRGESHFQYFKESKKIWKSSAIEEHGIVERASLSKRNAHIIDIPLNWYTNLFLLILRVTIRNAYVLRKTMGENNVSFATFKVNLLKQIDAKYGTKKWGNTGDSLICENI
ncbi:uncharacterized protein LOC111615591 [Centruroides sculpturatus]|uniref:uncharacterized protein LOC111615591 n=1 Tax=Centruroides sculpturatus TaxID=218467 RepID=UPI000C6DF5E3|nr:uncharacterized protein LOC111615591 [Centruroides sculpturatus]